jgi:hypothetical protein
MSKLVPTLILAAFAATAMNVQAASHAGGAPAMKAADAASAPAKGKQAKKKKAAKKDAAASK